MRLLQPNVKRRPGITDFSSIVLSDEGDILAGSDDPDIKYNQMIRSWKSRLGLLYVQKHTFFVDLQVIWLTVIAIVSRSKALNGQEMEKDREEKRGNRNQERGNRK